ncbi:MAG: formate C-acetyltransferase [Mycoplasmoidaceae bacterium]|nr:MAG: formate C-acetyltransferase [Mycoplasmoidaceae bacterium]
MYDKTKKIKFHEWEGFNVSTWCNEINVRDFIQMNYTPYYGAASFLTKPTKNTITLWGTVSNLVEQERKKGGVLDMDTRVSSIDAFGPGYIDKRLEKIVGLQTDAPLKRAYMPVGGVRMADMAAISNGFKPDPSMSLIYSKYRKTHNQGVFDAYTKEITDARHTHIITGLPDAYARGRIIGDYRRVALYGMDFLIKEKKQQREKRTGKHQTDEIIRMREETMEQIKSMNAIVAMAKTYGFDITLPAKNAQECVQWIYFGYLAAIKEQNGAAMSIGRVSTFIDIYIQRDINNGILTEQEAQEIMDHFIMKLRMVRFIRTSEYNQIFSGDPIWATESIGGMGIDGRTLVTKNSFRVLQSLVNMGPAPEPNITVLWSDKLPEEFKKFCAESSIKFSSIQYESDDLIRKTHEDDYGIACCVSPMIIGKQMQFFGARANLPKALLYAINGGIDEIENNYMMGPKLSQLPDGQLKFSNIYSRYKKVLAWLARIYVNALNTIHYMHDKYYYEAAEMALHDINVHRFFATGIAGLSIAADSLSAIKYAKVTPVWKQVDGTNRKVAINFITDGKYPAYGNNDNRVDKIAVKIIRDFYKLLKKEKTYRNSELTMSILTITSNVVYGKATGHTPDGRKAGQPFSPGANPFNGRDNTGAINSLSSVAKLPYRYAMDGISNTWTVVPNALGKDSLSVRIANSNKDLDNKETNLVNLLDGYFKKGGYHLNVNVLNKDTLLDAQKNPSKYPQLTIRVSGYAVNFIKLTKEQQDDVISRTFHTTI